MSEAIATLAAIDTPQMRCANAELLSLALMDARNHTLHLLAQFEQTDIARQSLHDALVWPEGRSPLWWAGHLGWLAEYWIARNPQRALGAACPARGMRLASIYPLADVWFQPALAAAQSAAAHVLPPAEELRAYLMETLETTLDLLEKARADDAGWYLFRMALFHEDLRGEHVAVLAQTRGVPLALELPPGAQTRMPLSLPACTWRLGWSESGFALDIEQGSDEVRVPEFEIDAQPVTWAQYVEFIDEGGYDREELWSAAGWQWLQSHAQDEGRRGPRYVEQIGVASGAVLQTSFGKPTRRGASQSVMHVTWWEADAYARWARRRLPTEVEWEIAAHQATRQGFRWGDVREWTAGTVRPWPGFKADNWSADALMNAQPFFGRARVQRGASFAARARTKHPKARAWALPEDDAGFVGFRTCAI